MTTTPSSRSRRHRRLGIDAHTEFVATLVSELDSAVARVRDAARRIATPPVGGVVDLVDPDDIERPAEDLRRLVRLLEVIDAPAERHHLELISLSEMLGQAAKTLDIELSVRGESGRRRFLGSPESISLGLELILLAVAGDGQPVTVGFFDDHLMVIGGAFDPADDRQAWHLRCGRRVLEGENCRVRLISGRPGYRVEVRALES